MSARLLRLYISAASPSDKLLQVTYLIQHFTPMWFHIRGNSDCSSGAKNVMRSVELPQQPPRQLQKVIQPVIQRDCYWVHPEALFLAMLTDRSSAVRHQAVETIQQCRQQERQQESGRSSC